MWNFTYSIILLFSFNICYYYMGICRAHGCARANFVFSGISEFYKNNNTFFFKFFWETISIKDIPVLISNNLIHFFKFVLKFDKVSISTIHTLSNNFYFKKVISLVITWKNIKTYGKKYQCNFLFYGNTPLHNTLW